MVTRATTTLLILLAGGCATSPPTARDVEPPAMPSPAASALAFTPPVAYAVADDLPLDRDARRQVAFGTVETVLFTETWVRQDDRYRFGRFGDYGDFERHAVSTRVTVGGR